MSDLTVLTDNLTAAPISTDQDIEIWKLMLDNVFQTNEGITYFGLTTLYSFDYITETDVVKAVNEWQAGIDYFCDEMIAN